MHAVYSVLPLAALVLAQTNEVANAPNAVTSINNNDGTGAGTDSYTYYQGDGTTKDGWPGMYQWVSFVDMFNNNKPAMMTACSDNGAGQDDSGEEIGRIYNAIEQIAQQSQVDHRFILAVIMQESGGCVRIQGTVDNDGQANPGLMQSEAGTSCSSNDCSQSVITQMVMDGTQGTNSGPGLAGLLNQVHQQYNSAGGHATYQAARLYNSGYLNPNDLTASDGTTQCYASDIANRLMGWVNAQNTCPYHN